MKDLLDSMTVAQYFGRIMSLPLAQKGKKYNYENHTETPRPSLKTSRMLSRYREYVNRRNNLLNEIKETTNFLINAEKHKKGYSGIKSHSLTDLYISLGETSLRIKECEEIRDRITDQIAKQAVIFRYFTNTNRKIPSWSETAKETGIPLSGRELQYYVNRCLENLLQA